ncbi:hypothetical protein ALC60_00861 [Trachymyrmex zeteki]|uniref:Uncharacterized protein n=1 Tax=Mycetomoellerius zeteki TaxID=64791 RepID=A0A151XI62_9HYME|nr:hypothetical protein ALC60_00861 [Trachymyrmex zeteki]
MVQEYLSSLFQEIHGSESRNNEIQPLQLRKDAKLRARKRIPIIAMIQTTYRIANKSSSSEKCSIFNHGKYAHCGRKSILQRQGSRKCRICKLKQTEPMLTNGV